MDWWPIQHERVDDARLNSKQEGRSPFLAPLFSPLDQSFLKAVAREEEKEGSASKKSEFR